MRVARYNRLATDKSDALGFSMELEFKNVGFCGVRKTGKPGQEAITNATHI